MAHYGTGIAGAQADRVGLHDDVPEGDRPLPNVGEIGPIERANLGSLLSRVEERLGRVESKLEDIPSDGSRLGKTAVEIAKVVFGAWPAFGLLFLILFYSPLRAAINAIPERVKGADEVTMLGLSFKTTLRAEAQKSGALQLSTTLPSLSPPAVELLLRTSPSYNSMFSYSRDGDLLNTVWLPSESMLTALEELESKNLVSLTGGASGSAIRVQTARDYVASFMARHPGSSYTSASSDQVVWTLAKPRAVEMPHYGWKLSDLGTTAVNVTLKAVSAELAPKQAVTAEGSK